jgi:hypothetical protein
MSSPIAHDSPPTCPSRALSLSACPVYQPTRIKELVEGPRKNFPLGSRPPFVFIAIDPSGGASTSDSAIVSLTYDEFGNTIVSPICVVVVVVVVIGCLSEL